MAIWQPCLELGLVAGEDPSHLAASLRRVVAATLAHQVAIRRVGEGGDGGGPDEEEGEDLGGHGCLLLAWQFQLE